MPFAPNSKPNRFARAALQPEQWLLLQAPNRVWIGFARAITFQESSFNCLKSSIFSVYSSSFTASILIPLFRSTIHNYPQFKPFTDFTFPSIPIIMETHWQRLIIKPRSISVFNTHSGQIFHFSVASSWSEGRCGRGKGLVLAMAGFIESSQKR